MKICNVDERTVEFFLPKSKRKVLLKFKDDYRSRPFIFYLRRSVGNYEMPLIILALNSLNKFSDHDSTFWHMAYK